MEKLDPKKIKEYLSSQGFSTVNGLIDGYQIDPETKIFLHKSEVSLVKGFGLPDGFVITPPPKPIEDAVLRFIDNKWVQDKEYFNEQRIKEFNEKREQLKEELDDRIRLLERKISVNRATPEEVKEKDKYVHIYLNIDSLDPTDPSVRLPNID